MLRVAATAIATAAVLLAGSVSGRREHIQVHSGARDWELPGDEFEAVISEIWETYVKRAKKVSEQTGKPYTAAESMLSLFRAVHRNEDYRVKPCNKATTINKAGYDKAYEMASAWEEKDTPTEYWKKSFDDLAENIKDANGCIDMFVASNMLSARQMSAARVGVLKDVFVEVTKSLQTPMRVGQMKCKDPDKQKFFFYCMHGDCDVKNEGPVDFNTFKLYYNSLGMFIASDEQFELMLVNAWHMMGARSWKGGKYSEVNTVNVRMRCFEAGEDIEGEGTYLTLNPDCPNPRKDRTLATNMAREQTGKAFKNECFFGWAG